MVCRARCRVSGSMREGSLGPEPRQRSTAGGRPGSSIVRLHDLLDALAAQAKPFPDGL